MPIASEQFLEEPARRTPLLDEADVLVLGGGPAGIAAAVCAARSGARTLLVERYGFLGGMGTAAGVTNSCGLYANVHGDIRRVVHGVASDLFARIEALGGLSTPHLIFGKTRAQAYDMSAYKCAADDLLLAAGAKLLFHAQAVGVVMRREGEIDALLIETRSGRRALRARIFIDASGDGDLAAYSGAPWDKSEHLLYPTLMFKVNNVDAQQAKHAVEDIPRLMREAEASGAYRFARMGAIVRPMKNPNEWRANVTQIRNARGLAMDGTDAAELSAGEIEGRRQVRDYIAFLRERVPGFAASTVSDIAPQVGIRETRRLRGEYRLTGEDVLDCRDFADAIGVNGWPLEQHVAGDVRWSWPAIPESRGYNQLPYRMLLPLKIDNLLVAGRCASMTQAGQSAARVSGGCFVMGQAAGTAAAMAAAQNRMPRAIEVKSLQTQLESEGAYLGRDVT